MNTCTYNLRPADPYYQQLVNRITRMAGMSYTIDVYESDTPNACATMFKTCSLEPSKPIISYNPAFIDYVARRSHWAVIAIFAHEVAHHYNEDLYGTYVANLFGSRKLNVKSHRQELNADRFAGWVLRHEGALHAQALEMYSVYPFTESETHPSEHKRKMAMTQGWVDAHKYLTPQKFQVRRSNHMWGLH